MKATPARGDIWTVALDPVRGHEQGGRRHALMVSSDRFNRSRAGLVVVVPMTSVDKGIRAHVEVRPPEAGLRRSGFAKPEDVRSISTERLGQQVGAVSPATLELVEARLRFLLEL